MTLSGSDKVKALVILLRLPPPPPPPHLLPRDELAKKETGNQCSHAHSLEHSAGWCEGSPGLRGADAQLTEAHSLRRSASHQVSHSGGLSGACRVPFWAYATVGSVHLLEVAGRCPQLPPPGAPPRGQLTSSGQASWGPVAAPVSQEGALDRWGPARML